ncbi:hypothetical protein WICMUC_002911 [Wickerhamomyces mucosus]|uniref:Uncharacterized protein n=1 Tax=Wickerhamomyces mucosus TaxID=1378264 RepID=A0A9P8TDS7_9ASCO|nr:hypothetical protein WICMUC_002911 [Wickerhamomyces mucosus]
MVEVTKPIAVVDWVKTASVPVVIEPPVDVTKEIEETVVVVTISLTSVTWEAVDTVAISSIPVEVRAVDPLANDDGLDSTLEAPVAPLAVVVAGDAVTVLETLTVVI